MAIAVGTNSTTSPRQPVSLTTLSVSGHNTADLVESKSITKTPLTANSTVASSPYNTLAPSPVTNTAIVVTKYNTADQIESLSITKTPLTANTTSASSPYNILNISPVRNTTTTVTSYNTNDLTESQSIIKTPFGISVPFAWSSISSGGYSGADIVITEYADEYWITQ